MSIRAGLPGVMCGAVVVVAAAVLSASCASVPATPRTFAFVTVEPGAPRPSGMIASYPQALEAVLWVMQNRLGFPPFSGALELCPDRASMALGLEAEGYDPAHAARAAAELVAVSRPDRIFANDSLVHWRRWPDRITLLAHEMTHVAEYALAGGLRGSSAQWLREGLAEWVSWRVVDELGLGSYAARRRTAVFRLRRASDERTLPPFRALFAPGAWVRNGRRRTADPHYDQALLAAEFLVARHGLPAILRYFRLCGRSADAEGVFREAFGEPLPEFEPAFQARLESELR